MKRGTRGFGPILLVTYFLYIGLLITDHAIAAVVVFFVPMALWTAYTYLSPPSSNS